MCQVGTHCPYYTNKCFFLLLARVVCVADVLLGFYVRFPLWLFNVFLDKSRMHLVLTIPHYNVMVSSPFPKMLLIVCLIMGDISSTKNLKLCQPDMFPGGKLYLWLSAR